MKDEGKSNELGFFSNDPGASRFGNFINYYSFHNVEERTSHLNTDIVPKLTTKDIICLDIGCNTGNLTKELHSYLKTNFPKNNLKILAIDIDPTLIERAQESNETEIKFLTNNIMESEGKDQVNKYLLKHNKERFDIIFCFSVTMWIHINNGDDGLIHFLNYIKSKSRSIVIEPQPWKCYRNAQKRLKKAGSSFKHYESLKIRSHVDDFIEKNICEDGFSKVYESQYSSWDRRIKCYHYRD